MRERGRNGGPFNREMNEFFDKGNTMNYEILCMV